MITVWYPDFLENPTSYDAIEAMWQDFFDALATENGFFWRPYINLYLSNGEKDRDANPIFSALVESQNRGVRIIQCDTSDGLDLYISGWLDRMDDFDGIPDSDELVIDLILSEETKAIAEELIRAWLVEQVDKETMDKLLDEKIILAAE